MKTFILSEHKIGSKSCGSFERGKIGKAIFVENKMGKILTIQGFYKGGNMKIEKKLWCNGDDDDISGVEVDNSSTPAPDWTDWDSTPAQEQSDEPDKY